MRDARYFFLFFFFFILAKEKKKFVLRRRDSRRGETCKVVSYTSRVTAGGTWHIWRARTLPGKIQGDLCVNEPFLYGPRADVLVRKETASCLLLLRPHARQHAAPRPSSSFLFLFSLRSSQVNKPPSKDSASGQGREVVKDEDGACSRGHGHLAPAKSEKIEWKEEQSIYRKEDVVASLLLRLTFLTSVGSIMTTTSGVMKTK